MGVLEPSAFHILPSPHFADGKTEALGSRGLLHSDPSSRAGGPCTRHVVPPGHPHALHVLGCMLERVPGQGAWGGMGPAGPVGGLPGRPPGSALSRFPALSHQHVAPAHTRLCRWRCPEKPGGAARPGLPRPLVLGQLPPRGRRGPGFWLCLCLSLIVCITRSEERRVGKECLRPV